MHPNVHGSTRTWQQPKCPSTDEWTKMWCVYTVACGSAIKKNGGEKNEIMPFAATWMDPEVKLRAGRLIKRLLG